MAKVICEAKLDNSCILSEANKCRHKNPHEEREECEYSRCVGCPTLEVHCVPVPEEPSIINEKIEGLKEVFIHDVYTDDI